MASVTFCFLVTRDLVKEHIWRQWFDRLAALDFKFNIITHVSPVQKDLVCSDWLRQTLLPDNYLCDTAWAWLMQAELALYNYAVRYKPAAWYTLHSESCVPFVTPEKFIEQFKQYKAHTFLSYSKAWWTPTPVPNDRANLHLLPTDYHWAHPQWSILCHADLEKLLELAATDQDLTAILLKGHTADESFLAIYLYKINNFQNVINKATTLVDWKRAPGGGSPYVFHDWIEADKTAVAELQTGERKNNYLFLRKVGPTFPDEILREWLFK
jgi:hypothetical protein